jgi:heme-degrading monooxygenase HmoA
MISRHWRGLAKFGHADRYVEHLRTETFPSLAGLAGFLSASILRRETEEGTEFLVVTNWESIEAIERFAGRDTEAAVVPAKARDHMIHYDRRARHYEVVE